MKLAELKAELTKRESSLAKIKKAGASDTEIQFAQKKIDKLAADIAAAEASPEKKVKEGAKRGPKTGSKRKKFSIEHNGKTYFEGDAGFCDAVAAKLAERANASKKAAKKHKTKPIGLQVSEAMVHAVEKAVDNISADDTKKYSKRYVVALRQIKKQFTALLSSFKTLLGEDYDRDEMRQPLEVINEMIEEIQDAVNKKMAQGGSFKPSKDGDKHKYYIKAFVTEEERKTGKASHTDKTVRNYDEAVEEQDKLIDSGKYEAVGIYAFKGNREVSIGFPLDKMANGGDLKGPIEVGTIIYATTGVPVKVLEYDSAFGGRVLVERADGEYGGNPMWRQIKKFTKEPKK